MVPRVKLLIYHRVCHAWPVRRLNRYLASLCRYQSDTASWQKHMCGTTCPGLHSTARGPEFEPATSWSQVHLLNHSATEPHKMSRPTQQFDWWPMIGLLHGMISRLQAAAKCHDDSDGLRNLHWIHTRYIFNWRPRFTCRRRSTRFCCSTSPAPLTNNDLSSSTKKHTYWLIE